MNTKKLKQLVLDLAIHGKLVPQDPNDEPASELLKRIQADVETHGRASNKSKGKKSAVSSVDLDEVPFEVPEGWCWTRLCDITLLIEDCPHTTAPNEGAGYALIRTPNIGEGHLIFDGVHRVSKEVYDQRNVRAIPQKNDLIFAREAPAGNIAVIGDEELVCLGQRTVLIRPYANYVESFWIAYYVLSPYSQNSLISASKGSTAQHVNMEKIRPFLIPLPPLAEQHRIVAAIEKWFAVIDQLEKNEADLKKSIEQTKKKVLDLAIRGKLVAQNPEDEPAGELLARIRADVETLGRASKSKKSSIPSVDLDEVPFEVPEGWEWCRICDIFNITLGQSPDGDSVSCDSNGTEFHQGKLAFADKIISKSGVFTSKPSKMACKDSLLLCMRAPVGDVNITDRDICIGRGLSALKPYASMPLSYWFYALQSVKVSLNVQATGSTFVAITGEILNNQLIPLPPLAEQKRIVEKIEEVMGVFERIEGMM